MKIKILQTMILWMHGYLKNEAEYASVLNEKYEKNAFNFLVWIAKGIADEVRIARLRLVWVRNLVPLFNGALECVCVTMLTIDWIKGHERRSSNTNSKWAKLKPALKN